MSPLWFLVALYLLHDEHPKCSPPVTRVRVGSVSREYPSMWANAFGWVSWGIAIAACVAGAVLVVMNDRGVFGP